MKELIERYQRLVIYRQSLIMLIAAPVPAAMVKMQGSLLTPDTIALILISANVFAMASMQLNKLSCKALFVGGNVVSFMACVGIVWMYFTDVSVEKIVIYFPIVSTLGFLLVGLASNQVKNALKDTVGDMFDISAYDAKKQSFTSGAAIIGQVLGVAFYMAVDVEPVHVLLVLESVNMTLYMFAEVQRWKLIKEMGLASV